MKLSARGRTVLAQVSRKRELPTEIGQESPDPGSVRTEFALLSDGVVAVKHTFLKPDGRLDHSGGWKVQSRLNAEWRRTLKTNPTLVIERWVSRYTNVGFTRVSARGAA